MRTMVEITEVIKGYKGFKEDAEVARFLNIKPKTFAASKSRNSIPYEELVAFCNQENISINWLLAGVGPRSLEVREEKLEAEKRQGAEQEYAEKLAAIMRISPEAAAYIKGMIDIKYQETKPEREGVKKGA